MAKRINRNNTDLASIDNILYNEKSGAQKNMEVGRHLLPLNDGSSGKTTDATTARSLPSKGKCLAVYNNHTAIGAVTLGENSSVTAELAGAVNVSTGNVGIPCKPGDWTFIACFDKQWVKSTASTLLVFEIADDTKYE